MESKFEVKTYVVKYICEPCTTKGGGEYTYTGKTLLTSPLQYEHRCDNCGNVQSFTKQYPSIEHEHIGGW